MTRDELENMRSLRATLANLQEQGVTHLSDADARQLAGGGAETLIANAHISDVHATVGQHINALTDRLYDPSSPDHISDDSYATRNDAHAELKFLRRMAAGVARLEPGGSLDLSRTETNYGYDPEEAQSYRDSGWDYVPAIERAEAEHRAHVAGVSELIKTLESAGVAVDTRFHATAPQEMWEYEEPDEHADRQAQATEERTAQDRHDIDTRGAADAEAESQKAQRI